MVIPDGHDSSNSGGIRGSYRAAHQHLRAATIQDVHDFLSGRLQSNCPHSEVGPPAVPYSGVGSPLPITCSSTPGRLRLPLSLSACSQAVLSKDLDSNGVLNSSTMRQSFLRELTWPSPKGQYRLLVPGQDQSTQQRSSLSIVIARLELLSIQGVGPQAISPLHDRHRPLTQLLPAASR